MYALKTGYFFHSIKCECPGKLEIPCGGKCSERVVPSWRSCATLYSEADCSDCAQPGVSLEFGKELIYAGHNVLTAAAFESHRLRNGCKLLMELFSKNRTVLYSKEEKYPWQHHWKVSKDDFKLKTISQFRNSFGWPAVINLLPLWLLYLLQLSAPKDNRGRGSRRIFVQLRLRRSKISVE